MAKDKWTEVGGRRATAFTFPCVGNYFYHEILKRHIGCTKPDGRHGHIELMSFEGGLVFIPYCCYSQAMVKLVVESLLLEGKGFTGIPDLPQVKQLPVEFTVEENLVLASPDELEKLAKWSRF